MGDFLFGGPPEPLPMQPQTPAPFVSPQQPKKPGAMSDMGKLAPLLAILPIVMKRGGAPAAAALLNGFQKAMAEKQQQTRQGTLDQQALTQQQQVERDRQAQIENQKLQQRTAFLGQARTGLDSIDSQEGLDAYTAYMRTAGQPYGIGEPDIAQLTSAITPSKLQQKTAAKKVADIGKTYSESELGRLEQAGTLFQIGEEKLTLPQLRARAGGGAVDAQGQPIAVPPAVTPPKAPASKGTLEQQYLDAIQAGDTALAAQIKAASNIRDNPKPPAGASSSGASDIDDNAQQLVDGTILVSQLSKRAETYNATLAKANRLSLAQTGHPLNLVKAQLDYEGAKRFMSAMNSDTRIRFRALADSVVNTIDEVRRLGDELKQGDIQRWNRFRRGTITQLYGNTPQSELANQYMGAVNTLKEEFANLAQGGTAPTEPAWRLANEQINGDFGARDLNASLTEVQRLINYRRIAFDQLTPILSNGPASPQQAAPPLTKDSAVGGIYTFNGKTVKVREKTRTGLLFDEVAP